MVRKKLISAAMILAIASLFAYLAHTKKPQPSEIEKSKPTATVGVQSASASTTLTQTIEYPANVVGDQEIKIAAKSTGNATAVNFNLGTFVRPGSLLVKIDDTGDIQKIGDESFRSEQVQQAGLSLDQARENLDLVNNIYHNLKIAYDYQQKHSEVPQTVTRQQVDAAAHQRDIAKTQYTTNNVGFKNTLDNHLITSPISGVVIAKSVSVGDSVAIGQQLLTISKNKNVKLQFYVDQSQIISFTKGMQISVTTDSNQKSLAVVKNISPVADPATKRFLIEAYPLEQNGSLLSGTVVKVAFNQARKASSSSLILPLSAITISQNESYIFIVENGRAKKINAIIKSVQGEAAEIQADVLDSDAQIIVSGNKLVQDGDSVTISSN